MIFENLGGADIHKNEKFDSLNKAVTASPPVGGSGFRVARSPKGSHAIFGIPGLLLGLPHCHINQKTPLKAVPPTRP